MAREQLEDPDENQERGTVRLNRRSYLKMAGVSIAATAALLDDRSSATKVPEATEMALYGYGGTQVFQQKGSITTSGFTGTVQDLTPTTESEDNDRRATADKISLGSTVSAELSQAEVDWYAFDAAAEQSVILELNRGSNEGIAALILYDKSGEYLNLRYVGTDQPATVTLNSAPSTGTYFAQVVDVQSGDGSYTLTVQDQEAVTPEPTATPTPEPTATPTPEPTATPTPDQTPYYGTARSIPGRIQAENFDEGGEGTAYHDTSTGSQYDTSYRDTDVDIREMKDTSGDYVVGYFQDGEWLEYTVEPTIGTYRVHFRITTQFDGEQLELSLGGEPLCNLEVPNTGGWFNWETITVEDVTIKTDQTQVLRIDHAGEGVDLNWIEFESVSPTLTPEQTATPVPTATPIPEPTATPTPTPVPQGEFGIQGYGEYGYGGVNK